VGEADGAQQKLRDGGVPQEQAEVHAEAARDFIMVELATKADLLATEQKLRTSISELHTDLRSTEQRLQHSIDNLSLRLTVRLGAMIVVAIGALAAILKLA
jgi:hypothetical protein